MFALFIASTALALWPGLLDALVAAIFAALERPEHPFWTSWKLRLFILVVAWPSTAFFYSSTIAGAGRYAGGRLSSLRVQKPAPNDPPPPPLHPISIVEVLKAAGEWSKQLTEPNDGKTVQRVADRVYDALRSGQVKSWGQLSNFYPPIVAPHRPALAFIEPKFWNDNTIEVLERAAGRAAYPSAGESEPWDSISAPDPNRFERSRTPCYWNIVFDSGDVRKKWPPSVSWMGR